METKATQLSNELDKVEIRMLPQSKVSKYIYYIYNTMLFINALMTIILTFIDDDWKESHNFDYITKILQGSLGALIFIGIFIYKVIPSLREKHMKLKIKLSPQKIQKQLLKCDEKKKKLLAQIEKYKKKL